ncbi:MAG: single-stranded DNA-binding protein [Ruminococcus sp.]
MKKINVIGRLTADVETRSTQSGGVINSFTVATNKSYGDKAHPLFMGVTFFNDIPTKMKLKKGYSVIVSGELRQNEYTNKDGNKVTNYVVIGESVEYAPSCSSNAMTPVTLIGRLSQEISTNEAKTAGHTSIAIDDGYGEKKKTNFFRLNLYGNVLERLLKATSASESNGKGTALMIKGDFDSQDFARKDGSAGKQYFINVEDFSFVSYGKKNSDTEETSETPVVTEAPNEEMPSAEQLAEEFDLDIDDDLPF